MKYRQMLKEEHNESSELLKNEILHETNSEEEHDVLKKKIKVEEPVHEIIKIEDEVEKMEISKKNAELAKRNYLPNGLWPNFYIPQLNMNMGVFWPQTFQQPIYHMNMNMNMNGMFDPRMSFPPYYQNRFY